MATTTYQDCDARVFEGEGAEVVAKEFVAALGGNYPLTVGVDAVTVDLTEWPEDRAFPAAVTELFAKRGVKVLD